ncbi:MFS transporter [Leekyejoonella antrihumi]|uniref:MFS transporter n=1 Tax=Leekyejoonella antrihumi TaxID=1660198 RepID=A0A563E9K5_9MICO|nr:MFS transporter [Leekyejoonella antrihumi]TWP38932.1 MFS transporter [Leekyejoonella antrihumi]
MTPLAVMTFAGFSGYAVLLPVGPMWAVHGGANEAGAGLVNGVLLLFTVITQMFVPAALRRLGWGPVVAGGLFLLGVPSLAYAVSDALGPVLALSAVRGVGFGVLTVTGSAAVAKLVEPARRGEAIGTYGLAIALPNLVLLPLGPWIADHAGFWVIFAISGMPIIGIPAGIRLARVIHGDALDLLHLEDGPAEASPVVESEGTAYRRLVRPMVLLLAVTLAGGAVITFAAQMVSSAWLTTAGLFVMGLVAAAIRWRAGVVADRHGPEPFIWPLVVLTCVGMVLTAYAVRDGDATNVAVFLVAMVIVGLAYGALQNFTLVAAFNAVSRPHHNLASAIWNVGFDAGTGLGSVVVGMLALRSSFSTALLVIAVLSIATLPVALRPPRKS